MRELKLQIQKCEDCPYYQYSYDAKDSLCFYRKETPFALIREGQTHIDLRCELPRVTSGNLVSETFDPNLA